MGLAGDWGHGVVEAQGRNGNGPAGSGLAQFQRQGRAPGGQGRAGGGVGGGVSQAEVRVSSHKTMPLSLLPFGTFITSPLNLASFLLNKYFFHIRI